MTALPDSIIQNGLFCCWKYEERNGRKTKVPYQPETGLGAKSNDPSSFVPYKTAVQASGYDGIGIGIFNGICAIDLDNCVSDSGYYTQTAAEIVALMHSYTEYSPSGNGLHILFSAKGFQYDTKRFYIMNHQAGIEVYVAGATNKYVTVTGNHCEDYEYGDRTQELQVLLDKFMRRPEIGSENAINAKNSDLSMEQLLQLAKNSKNGAAFTALWNGSLEGYSSPSEADLALCSHLAFWTGRDAAKMDAMFRQSGLMRGKWDRQQSGTTYGAITIQKAIEHCREIYTPKAESAPLFQPLVPLTPQWSDLPAFPVDALPDVIRNYVSAVAEHSQTAPGERKSSVMRDMTTFLYEYEQEYNKAHSTEIRENHLQRESLERQISGLQKKLERKESREMELELRQLQEQLEETPELKPVRFFADDCSSEALTSLMAANNGVFSVISTEGGIFDIMAGRYSNKSNIDVWLKGHCGDAIYVDRMTREAECIMHPALSAILSIQPCVLDEIMSNTTMTGRGLIARFLYASPPSRIGSRVFRTQPIPPEVIAAYRSLIFRLMALPIGGDAQTVHLSEKAFDLMADYFQEHEKFLVGEGQAISDWASKYIGAVLRIAGLLHCADMEDEKAEVTASTMSKAIQIGKYFLAHSTYAYSMMGTDLTIQKAKFVLAKLKKKNVSVIKRSELFQMCRGKFFKKTEEIFPTLELLEGHGYIRLEEPERQSVGRPADVKIIVNPTA